MRLADPRPGFCSVCYSASPEFRYIDFELPFDGVPCIDKDSNTIAILPWNGELAGNDALYICEACLQAACEELNLKPEAHSRLLRRMDQLENENRHWKATVQRLRKELDEQLSFAPVEPRRRKQAA